MTALARLAAVALSLLATLAAPAQERVSFPSFDGAGNAPVVLSGYFFPARDVAGAGDRHVPWLRRRLRQAAAR